MMTNRLVLSWLTLAVLVGCSTVEPLDGLKRQPRNSVEVFLDGNLPAKQYKVIATFSERDNLGREEQQHRNFVNKAKQLGADGVILQRTEFGGTEFGPFGGSSKAVYRAVAFVCDAAHETGPGSAHGK